MKAVKILDCTLRDGGYYNNWDFDFGYAKELIVSLNRAGVDMIELGYKSLGGNDFYGLFKYCNEELLDFVREYSQAEYAFMIDAKEFLLADGTIDLHNLNRVVRPRPNSIFSWVRIASHNAAIDSAPALIAYFQEKGYQVCFNLMGGSLISEAQLLHALKLVARAQADVFYLADSFGSFYPAEVKEKIAFIRTHFPGQIGVHLHDNQGLAYANALAAIEAGADIVDATVCGMGRGAGNLLLEQFMLGYKEKYQVDDIRPNELLPVINQYFQPLKDHYKWGFNYVYMFSGLYDIHQSYCQSLSSSDRYSISQVSEILGQIPPANRSLFNRSIMEEAIKHVLKDNKLTSEEYELPKYEIQPVERVLIVANGPSLRTHRDSLTVFHANEELNLIECNDTEVFEHVPQRKVIILNKLKLNKYLAARRETHPELITGETSVPENLPGRNFVFHQPFELEAFSVSEQTVKIPDYDVGMYAIAIALMSGAESIYLAGFDGFTDPAKNEAMEAFFAEVSAFCHKYKIKFLSITPTSYRSLDKSSVYALI